MTKHRKPSNKKYSKGKKPKKKVKPNNTKRLNKSFKINSKGALEKIENYIIMVTRKKN